MSLFDDLDTEQDNTSAINNNSDADGQSNELGGDSKEGAPSWWIDKDLPGQGDRPQWLSDKFNSVADMAKSYSEMEKRLGKAPDEYDFSKASKFIDMDYEPFQEMANYAKEKRVPQDVMDKVVESFSKYLDEFDSDPTEERELLGENAKERLQILNNWARSNLEENEFAALATSMRTADSIKALEKLRSLTLTNSTQIPNGNDSQSQNVESVQSIQSEMALNIGKYETDSNYRNEIKQRIEKATQSHGSNFRDQTSVV